MIYNNDFSEIFFIFFLNKRALTILIQLIKNINEAKL